MTAAFVLAPATGCGTAAPASASVAGTSSSTATESVPQPFEPLDSKGIEVPVGTAVSADLDGDGTEEEIFFDWHETADDPCVPTLTINGTEFANDPAMAEAYLFYPDRTYTITDLDTADGLLEIAISDNGPSSDPVTYFFHYDGAALSYLGSVSDMVSGYNFKIDGKGRLRGEHRATLLQTWYVIYEWKLENGKIVEAPQPYYAPNYYEFGVQPTVTLAQPLKLYREMGTSAETFTLQPGDAEIWFTLTDDKEWVQLQQRDDNSTKGWMHMTDFITIDNDGETNAMNVFNGLFLAD